MTIAYRKMFRAEFPNDLFMSKIYVSPPQIPDDLLFRKRALLFSVLDSSAITVEHSVVSDQSIGNTMHNHGDRLSISEIRNIGGDVNMGHPHLNFLGDRPPSLRPCIENNVESQ